MAASRSAQIHHGGILVAFAALRVKMINGYYTPLLLHWGAKGDAMSGNAKNTISTIIPAMRYRDASAAIEWLCKAFGFEERLVVHGEDGTVAHAQLSFGNGMIMLGSVRDDEFGHWPKPPQEAGGIGTQSAYVIVDDADAHYARAKAAGARIVMEPADQDYGGRLYACCDPEGHLWNFGTYDPWPQR